MIRWTSLLLSYVAVAVPWAIAQPRNDSDQILAVAANGYRANLESFEIVTCRYTVTWGFAKSLDDALAGRLEPGARTATAVFYRDGQSLRFRIEEDAATKAALDKPHNPEKMSEIPGLRGGPLVPFMTADYLLNESHGFHFNPRHHAGTMYDQGTEKGKQVDPYFLMANLQVNSKYDFGLLADQAARGEIRYTPVATSSEGHFRATFHFATDPTVSFTIDLTRGSLPTRIEKLYANGADGASYVVVPQIRACSKGRWFPERIVTFAKQTPTQSPCLVKDFKVIELDVDNRPPKDALTIDLPAGTVINQFADSRKYFKTRQPEKIGPDDLARIQHLTETVPQEPLTDTTIVLPRSYRWLWYVVGGIALLVLAFFGRRYMSSRRQHAPA